MSRVQLLNNLYGERAYLDLLKYIKIYGTDKTDRTGVGTRSIFGAQLRFNLEEGFPLLTTKKIHTKSVFAELAWLIQGGTNVGWLNDRGVTIWDEWADANGDLGPIYGKQWRDWSGDLDFDISENVYPGTRRSHDQLRNALNLIQEQPDSRRIVVSAWNPGELNAMALQPCHALYQFEVHDHKLSCHMYQRSADIFLGVPFNIASYAGLTHYMAQLAGIGVGELIVSFGDIHIYNNHFDQVETQLKRTPRTPPTLTISSDIRSLDQEIDYPDFQVRDYRPHDAIFAPVAV